MNRKKLTKSQKEATYRYRKKNIEKIRKQDRKRKQKTRLKRQLIISSKKDMDELFQTMEPVLFKWAQRFAFWDKNFEINELINAAFANGSLRRVKNSKHLNNKVKWAMQDYMKKVRRDNSIDVLIQRHVEMFGRIPFNGIDNI